MPKSVIAALNYNEKKVQKKTAICLHAAGYLKEANDMNFYQKLAGLERLNVLNERATTKTLHVSLNFDPSEKHSNQKLIAIADKYMNKIGFGRQPFLVYKHEDAGHPHIHIVSTTIQPDGSRINTHNIGRNQSEKARKEIEKEYGLLKAEKQQHILLSTKPVNPVKLVYGKSETKKAIANIVTMIFNQYKFGSLPEFNAALRQYNVIADRGKEEGRIFKHRGLVYRVLDDNGNKVGVPIKASLIGCEPTLNNLEKKMMANQVVKENVKAFVRAKLDDCLFKQPVTLKELTVQLESKNIYTLLRQNAEGRLYGITFVDNQNKVVFNGSDLGKSYSAAALQSRLTNSPGHSFKQREETTNNTSTPLEQRTGVKKQEEKPDIVAVRLECLAEALFQTKQQYDAPNSLLKKKRKRKRKKPDL